MIEKDAKRFTDFCHHVEGYGAFSPWLDEYDPFTETGVAFVHCGSEDNGQFGLGDIDLGFGKVDFTYQDVLEKVKKYRDECKGQMDPDFPEECEYVDELDELVRALTDWCNENESKKSEATDGLDSLVGIKTCKELEKKIDSLGFTFVESGDYAGLIWGYAVYKSPKGEYIQYDFNGTNDTCRNVKVFKSKQDFIDEEGYDPEKSESAKNKKSEGVEALKDKVVSDGTLKPEDLIPKFLNALKHDETAHSKFLKDNPEILEIQSWDDVDDETKSMLVDELTDALNGIAPDGYFFGASDGDGACFGFWKVDPDESKKSEARECMLCATFGKGNNVYYAADDKGDSWTDDHEEAYVFSTRADAKKAVKSFVDTLNSGVGDHFNWTASKVSIAPWIGTSESKKSEDYKNFTLKQLRFQLKNGWAKDLTNASDEEIQAIIDSGHEISGVSNGTYGMNGLKVTYSNPDGSIGSGVVIGRTPNLFALLSPQKPKKTGDAPKPSESKKSEGVGGKIKMGIDYNMFMRMCASAAYLDSNEDYWDALWEYYSEMGEIEDACEFFDNLFQYTSWCDEDEVYDEYLDDSYKDGTKSKAECIEAAVDAGDLDVFKTDKGYLVIQ